jgi:hypothetical protein
MRIRISIPAALIRRARTVAAARGITLDLRNFDFDTLLS